jgi:GlpG protein
VIHLVFNMFWLFDLGRSIENRMGTATLLGIVVTSAGISNLAQYLWSGFDFGGMSGVVYALFGYCWLRGWIRESTVFILLGWLLFCMTGLIGNIANAAHVMGLVVGVAWGWSASRRLR